MLLKTILDAFTQEQIANFRGGNYMQVILIVWIMCLENQLKHLHNLSLNMHNFPCVNIYVTFGLKSQTLNTAQNVFPGALLCIL